MLRRYIRPTIGTRILASLSPLEIQAAYQVMVDRKLSARTVRYAHAVLRAAIRQAIRWQLLLHDPTQGAELPGEQCREMSVLTTEQARSFLRTASHSPQACLFAVALTTGIRPSEYLALCWRDIDWGNIFTCKDNFTWKSTCQSQCRTCQSQCPPTRLNPVFENSLGKVGRLHVARKQSKKIMFERHGSF